MREAQEPAGQAREEGDEFTRAPLDAGRPPRRRITLGAPAFPGLPGVRLPRAGGRVAALAASALLVAVVAVGLFLHTTSNPVGAISTLLRLATPTPSATFAPGANVVYFSNGAPWGTLTLDGKRLPAADLTGGGDTVSRGRHHLIYQARYFPSVDCYFSAPASVSDTCRSDISDAAVQFLLGHGQARVITLGSTGATIQREQLAALTLLANAQLQAQTLTTTIAPGERYVDDHGQVAVASAPLQFTMTLALDDSNAPAQGPDAGGSFCAQFCPDPSFQAGGAPAPRGWSVRVGVTALWTITDDAGNRLTSPGYQAGQPYPEVTPALAEIDLTSGGWRISGLEGLSASAVTNAAFSTLSIAMDGPSGSGGGYGATLGLGRDPLVGCVVDVSLNDTGNGGGPSAHLLWRFGVLLAVDANARKVFPQMPVATAAEQALASSIDPQQATAANAPSPLAALLAGAASLGAA